MRLTKISINFPCKIDEPGPKGKGLCSVVYGPWKIPIMWAVVASS